MPHYPDVNPNPDFPKIEENVLRFWKENRLFERSVENRAGKKEFIFYDGYLESMITREDMVEKGSLTTSEEPSDDGYRNHAEIIR